MPMTAKHLRELTRVALLGPLAPTSFLTKAHSRVWKSKATPVSDRDGDRQMPCILIDTPGQEWERGALPQKAWRPGVKSDHTVTLTLYADANPANDSADPEADRLQGARPAVPGALEFDGDAIAHDRVDDLADQVLAALHFAPGFPHFAVRLGRNPNIALDHNHHVASLIIELTICDRNSDCVDRPADLTDNGTPITTWALWVNSDPDTDPPTTGSP